MTNQDPSQTPRECPACNAPIVAEDLCYGGHLIEYTCGAMFNSRIQEWGGRCSSAFSAAVSLRAERDAALAQVESWRKRIEAHMDYIEPKIDRTQENVAALTARLAELQAQLQECAEVLAYCRPSFPHIMGNDDWAIEQIKKQGELRKRFDDLIVALESGA